MQNTTNFNLKKPDYADPVDIQDINDNMDIIDTKIAEKGDTFFADWGVAHPDIIPEHIKYLATDEDFFWVDTTEMEEGAPPSFYLYIGTEKIVSIPEKINGNILTSCNHMFIDGSLVGHPYTAVTKVININSNITTMEYTFIGSQATSLDLSSFDTSKVNEISNMFQNSQTTTGYARTQADADKFNASSNKPTGLNFVVKP